MTTSSARWGREAQEAAAEAPLENEARPVSHVPESGARLRTETQANPRAEAQAEPLRELHARRDAHPLWRCRLLRALAEGALTLEDLRYVFAQLYPFACARTRYVAALLAQCDSDVLRARLAESLLAEAAKDDELGHAHAFRRFLARALGVSLDGMACDDAARLFVDEHHRVCLTSSALAGCAFLALGAEGIAPRLHAIFAAGLRAAGVDEAELALFRGDAGDGALERILASHAQAPAWSATCEAAMELSLGLHARFFESLYEALRVRRVRATLNAIQSRIPQAVDASALRYRGGGERKLLYASRAQASERANVDFLVERIPLGADVLDARLLRVPVGKRSEEEGHAHETFLHVLRGWGRVVVGEERVPLEVAPGDSVLVPRWSPHHVVNLGESEIVCLAVTDFHFADRAFIGDARTYRV